MIERILLSSGLIKYSDMYGSRYSFNNIDEANATTHKASDKDSWIKPLKKAIRPESATIPITI